MPDTAAPAGQPGTRVLDWGSRLRLHVLDAGLACCAVEVSAAAARRQVDHPGAAPFAHDPERADVLLVSGTVTDKLLPSVVAAYDALPGRRLVVAFGACVASGGPYWDSYSVTKGVDQVLPVDLYVPGCPPRPEALTEGLARLERSLADGAPLS
ncbi:NADH-quinone oxidoreductase subunit B [Motilibacter peucedani]|uniref:NADH-quinone oxidoreductase subunit B n=1 Tax=Motilibacter peucedani TaxID=598650 RepID=A0A420XKU8_9ACTN|nr:NADH-quinone oxidoreductase subunit NuoB [Motilibacter peucedani]RKS69229.1 NADH-quinone oxidoreductase subunit B [Motilibacter peucedani]